MATSTHVPFRSEIVEYASTQEVDSAHLTLSVRINRSSCAPDGVITAIELSVEGGDEFLMGLTARLQLALQVEGRNTTMFIHAFKDKLHVIQTFLANFFMDKALCAAYCGCLGDVELNIIQLMYEREKGSNGVAAVTTAS